MNLRKAHFVRTWTVGALTPEEFVVIGTASEVGRLGASFLKTANAQSFEAKPLGREETSIIDLHGVDEFKDPDEA